MLTLAQLLQARKLSRESGNLLKVQPIRLASFFRSSGSCRPPPPPTLSQQWIPKQSIFVFTTVLLSYISSSYQRSFGDPGLRSLPLCLRSLESSEFIFHLINIPDCGDSSLSASIWVLIPHALFAQVWQVTWYCSEEFIDNNHKSCLIQKTKVGI